MMPNQIKMSNPTILKAKKLKSVILKNRVLTIYKENDWTQKIDLPEGKLRLDVNNQTVYSE